MDRRGKPSDDAPGLVVEEAPQLPAPRRMLQLAQRLGLDLPDALARHRELLADLFERVVGVQPRRKRMRSTRSSRGVSEASTRVVVSRRFDWIAAS